MTLSTFALILAVVELLIGLPLLVAPRETADWLVRLSGKDIQCRLVGAVLLVICVLVLAEDASVDWSVAGVLRLWAWLGAVKCLVLCWWPGWLENLAELMLARPILQRAFGLLATAVGAFLFWAGTVV